MLNEVLVVLCIAVLVLAGFSALGQEDLRVLPEMLDGVPPTEMMKEYLLGQIAGAWEQWKTDYEARTEPEAIDEYQRRMHDRFTTKRAFFRH